MKKTCYIISILFLVSCGSTKLLTPTAADVERGKNKIPDLTMEALNKGKEDYQLQCASCHGLKNPASRTEEEWKTVVPRMAAKARKKAGKEVIDQAAQESILKYLVTMSKS